MFLSDANRFFKRLQAKGKRKLEEKQKLREKIWETLEKKGVARFPLPVRGRIPNFEGSGKAAKMLASIGEWEESEVIVANPDYAQKKVRELALKDKKTLLMATPKLKEGYLKIEPERVGGKEEFASTIRGAFKLGEKIKELPPVDLIVTGCVAVDLKGRRLGKGGGYGDREIAMIKEKYGNIPVATTVHELQIVKKIPWEPHDQEVDIITTPKRVIRVKN